MHVRKKIRNALMDCLLGLETVGDNVYSNPVQVFDDEELPAIIIATDTETIEYQHPSYPRVQTRTLNIEIIICAKANDIYQDLTDNIILEIEDRLGQEEYKTFNGLVQWHEIKDIRVGFTEQSNMTLAEAKISVEFVYRTPENDNSINV